MPIQIIETNFFAPTPVETAEDLSSRVGKSAAWIIEKTGVAKRHVSDMPLEKMSATVCKPLIEKQGTPDLLINASLSPRQLIPDTSVFVMNELGLSGIPSFTVNSTCISFLVALHTANALLENGSYNQILIVSSEMGSVSRNFEEPESAVLIGDGAGAAVVTRTPDGQTSRVIGCRTATFPDGRHMAELRGCGTFRHPNNPQTAPEDNLFHMKGPSLYRFTVRRVAVLVKRLLRDSDLTPSDIDWVVPHQASGPALSAISRFGFSQDRIINIVGEYGNCIAASIPMALAHANQQGQLQRGQKILLLGTAAGLSIGAMILEW